LGDSLRAVAGFFIGDFTDAASSASVMADFAGASIRAFLLCLLFVSGRLPTTSGPGGPLSPVPNESVGWQFPRLHRVPTEAIQNPSAARRAAVN
jgi:hypothetical protein